MSEHSGAGTAGGTVLSRRDAIVGALALAAGALIASKPEVAAANSGDAIVAGTINLSAGTTYLWRTSNGFLNPVYSEVELGGATDNVGAHRAVSGHVNALAGTAATGVRGSADAAGQFGVIGENTAPGGTALRVNGRASFSRSGRHSIPKGQSAHTVTGVADIATNSMILVTLQGSGGTGVYLKYAARVSATSFKVVLSKACTSAVTFAWMILD